MYWCRCIKSAGYHLVKLFISAIISVSGSSWALQCLCFGIYTHNTVPARAEGHLLSLFLFSARYTAIAAWRPDMRGVSTGLVPTHANGCVALTPFWLTACICIPLCINSVVLQVPQESYNACRFPLAALVFTMYLFIYCR